MTFADRALRTARLDTAAYEEVERDPTANWQAVGVVALSALAAGIGVRVELVGLLAIMLASLVNWYVWAFLTYWVGTSLLPEPQTHASPGELRRVLGFATSPGIIRVLGIVPPLRSLVFPVADVWMLVAGVVGVRQALDYRSTWRAVGVVAVGWIVQWLLLEIVMTFLGTAA